MWNLGFKKNEWQTLVYIDAILRSFKVNTVDMALYSEISGWWPPRVAQEVVHNRTINLQGSKGHNIAMDRVCEFLNADFKGTKQNLQIDLIWLISHRLNCF